MKKVAIVFGVALVGGGIIGLWGLIVGSAIKAK